MLYTFGMTPKPLTPDLAAALEAAGDDPLPVTNPNDGQVYYVVEGDLHRRAMQALRESEVVESIRRGVADPGMSLEESQRRTIEAIRRP